MTRINDALALAALLVVGAADVGASPLITLSNLQLGDELDLGSPDGAGSENAATTPAALGGIAGRDGMVASDILEAAPAGRTLGLTEAERSALAYPLSGSFSFGIAYELEDAEDVAAALIENGVVQADHRNHSLVVQTIWRFGGRK